MENKKYQPPITVLLFRNYVNFAKVDKSKINQNALIAKISTYKKTKKNKEKLSKFPKINKKRNKVIKDNEYLLKRLQMFYIFWANASK